VTFRQRVANVAYFFFQSPTTILPLVVLYSIVLSLLYLGFISRTGFIENFNPIVRTLPPFPFNPNWIHIVFWSLFGVLASTMYAVSYHRHYRHDFNTQSVPYYWSKIIQAPFIVVAVIAIASIITPSAGVSFEVGKTPLHALAGIAFILGYFSEETHDRLYNAAKSLLGSTVKPKERGSS
jgi:hypothetical protein